MRKGFLSNGPHQAKKCRFRSSCTCAKYHLGLCSPFIHSVVSSDSVIPDRDGPDQTVQMHRLIWAFATHICPKTGYCMASKSPLPCIFAYSELGFCCPQPMLVRKPPLGYWQTVKTQIRCHRMWHLIRVYTVCIN